MANEFGHKDVGGELSRAEWEGVDTHKADSQAANDMLYFNNATGNWERDTPTNILAKLSGLPLAGGTLTGDLSIEKDTPALYLKDTAVDGEDWKIESWAFAGTSWLRITYIPTDLSVFIKSDGQVEIRERLVIATSETAGEGAPRLYLECVDAGDDSWTIFNDRTDLQFSSDGVGALLLKLGMRLKVRSALAVDHTCTGSSALMTAGTALTVGQAVYVGADGKMEKAKADAAATMPAIALATGTINEDDEGEFLMQGFFRDNTWNWTPGALLYVSKDTAGALTETAPAAGGEQVQRIGIAKTADILYFKPDLTVCEVA